jgi:hypothetical protein
MYPRFLKSTRVRAAVAATAIFGLTACGDSSGPGSTGDISQAAAMEIATELLMFMFMVDFNVAEGAAAYGIAADRPAFSVTETFDETVPCNQSGTMRINGSYTDNVNASGTGSVSVDLRQTPNNCGVQTSQGLFNVNGNPNIRWTTSFNLSNWEPVGNLVFKMTGGFNYTGAGSGSCAIDVTYTINYNTNAFNASGRMCGHNITM